MEIPALNLNRIGCMLHLAHGCRGYTDHGQLQRNMRHFREVFEGRGPFDLLKRKLALRLLPPRGTFKPIFVYLSMFEFELAARIGQTDKQTDRQTNRRTGKMRNAAYRTAV